MYSNDLIFLLIVAIPISVFFVLPAWSFIHLISPLRQKTPIELGWGCQLMCFYPIFSVIHVLTTDLNDLAFLIICIIHLILNVVAIELSFFYGRKWFVYYLFGALALIGTAILGLIVYSGIFDKA